MNTIIKREKYLSQIRPFYDSNYIKAITGIRRSGKSQILLQIIDELKMLGINEKHIVLLDLEGKSGKGIADQASLEAKLDSLLTDRAKYYVFIDEVQHIKDFEAAVAFVRSSYNCSLFVTGSNSRLLKGALQDRLTGRAREIVVQPFSFSEACLYKGADVNGNEISSTFLDFLRWGGMPQRYDEPDDATMKKYLRGLYDSIVKKDIYGHHSKIRKAAFENIAGYVLSSAGQLFSPESIVRYLKNPHESPSLRIGATAIGNYAKYLEEAFFIRECKAYRLSGKEALTGLKKYYAIDNGFRSIFIRGGAFQDTFLLENVVFNELMGRGYEVYYGRTYKGEVDFVVMQGNKKCFIQVAYLLADNKTAEREFGAFEPIKDASPRFVLSLDPLDMSRDGIVHINILDFLLGRRDITLL